MASSSVLLNKLGSLVWTCTPVIYWKGSPSASIQSRLAWLQNTVSLGDYWAIKKARKREPFFYSIENR
jgi:hypothetical protein